MGFEVKFNLHRSKLKESISKIQRIFALDRIDDEYGNIILINRTKGYRFTFYTSLKDMMTVMGVALLRNEEDLNKIKSLVSIVSVAKHKLTILEFTKLVLSLKKEYTDKERVLEKLNQEYGISDNELKSYLNALKKLAHSKKSKSVFVEALNFLT